MKEYLNNQSDKVEKITKQLTDKAKKKEGSKAKCSDLKSNVADLIRDVEQARLSNEILTKFLQEAKVDLLEAG